MYSTEPEIRPTGHQPDAPCRDAQVMQAVVTVPVEQLHTVLLEIEEQQLTLEHLYDY